MLWAYKQSKVSKMWKVMGLHCKDIADSIIVQFFRGFRWIHTLNNLFSVVFGIYH